MTVKDILSKKKRNIEEERKALENYIIPISEYIKEWRNVIKECSYRLEFAEYDKVNEFIGFYVRYNKFESIKVKSYKYYCKLEKRK